MLLIIHNNIFRKVIHSQKESTSFIFENSFASVFLIQSLLTVINI